MIDIVTNSECESRTSIKHALYTWITRGALASACGPFSGRSTLLFTLTLLAGARPWPVARATHFHRSPRHAMHLALRLSSSTVDCTTPHTASSHYLFAMLCPSSLDIRAAPSSLPAPAVSCMQY